MALNPQDARLTQGEQDTTMDGTAEDPPPVDVYIDDGRYYQRPPEFHWNNTGIWSRRLADCHTAHQLPNRYDNNYAYDNYAYVKIRNRGKNPATNVSVKAYQCPPKVGLKWPTDFTQLTPKGEEKEKPENRTGYLSVKAIGAENSEQVMVGPFVWKPIDTDHGHDFLLFVISAGGPSLVDEPGQVIPMWKLVSQDNNVGLHAVNLVPGGEGAGGLVRGLRGAFFDAVNPLETKARMELRILLPRFLNSWQIIDTKDLPSKTFELEAGAAKRITLSPKEGGKFDKDTVDAADNRDIVIQLFGNDNLVGGMTYRLDSDVTAPK